MSEGAFNRNRKKLFETSYSFQYIWRGSVYPGEGLINGCMFLFTSRWAYNFGG